MNLYVKQAFCKDREIRGKGNLAFIKIKIRFSKRVQKTEKTKALNCCTILKEVKSALTLYVK